MMMLLNFSKNIYKNKKDLPEGRSFCLLAD